jgi:hypothetical protein
MRKETVLTIKIILYIKAKKIMASPAVEKTTNLYLILKVKNVLNFQSYDI